MNKLSSDIQRTARGFVVNLQEWSGNSLDYSLESLEEIDEMLGAFGSEELDEDSLSGLSSMAGCYIFEVARRNCGGEYQWLEQEQQPVLVAGLPDFSVGVKVWEKVRGRLLNGKEDNIPFYIAGYQEHISIGRKQKGYHVTIV